MVTKPATPGCGARETQTDVVPNSSAKYLSARCAPLLRGSISPTKPFPTALSTARVDNFRNCSPPGWHQAADLGQVPRPLPESARSSSHTPPANAPGSRSIFLDDFPLPLVQRPVEEFLDLSETKTHRWSWCRPPSFNSNSKRPPSKCSRFSRSRSGQLHLHAVDRR